MEMKVGVLIFIDLVLILIYQYFMSHNLLTGIFGEDRGF